MFGGSSRILRYRAFAGVILSLLFTSPVFAAHIFEGGFANQQGAEDNCNATRNAWIANGGNAISCTVGSYGGGTPYNWSCPNGVQEQRVAEWQEWGGASNYHGSVYCFSSGCPAGTTQNGNSCVPSTSNQISFRGLGGPYNPPSGCYVTPQDTYSDYWLPLWPVHNLSNGSTYNLRSSQNSSTGVSYSWSETTASGGYSCCGSYTDMWATCSFADEKNLGGQSCKVGHPCDPGNGNKYLLERDYESGDGLLTFTRSYNSQLAKNWGGGIGWIFSTIRKLELSASTIIVRSGDGRGEPFTKNSSGQWVGDGDTVLSFTQDATGYTLRRRNDATEHYNTSGQLVSETDTAGRVTAYQYDANTRLASVTSPSGHTLTFSYNTAGLLASVTNPNGGIYTYAYNNNRLTSVTYPDGSSKVYHYENAVFRNHITGTSYQDPGGAVTRYTNYTYDTSGRATLTELTGGLERFTLQYNSSTQTTVTDGANNARVMTYATNLGLKNLTSIVNQADSKSTTQAFDGNNNLTCRKDEEGRVTTYTYNSTNQKTGMTEGLTGTCASPTTTSVTRTTTYQYLSITRDLPTLITSPSVSAGQNQTVAITYGDSVHPSLPTLITKSGYTPSGTTVSRSISLTYNAAGQVTTIDGARTDVSDVTTLTYNECTSGAGCGQLQRTTNALGQITTYDLYDASGRLLQMTDPNGLRTNYTYDPRGRVTVITQSTSGSSHTTQYAYNAANNITSASLPSGTVLTYTYNAAQQLTRISDNLGNRVDYAYDLKGNRTGENTYDASGTLVRQITKAYDLRNHLTTVNRAGSVTQTVYDAINNLTQTTDPKSNPPTQNSFDALNRLIQSVNSANGTTAIAYDVNDRVKQVTAPNSATTQYQTDDLGNRISEVSPDRGTTSYTYDNAGNLKTLTDARGITANYSYDVLNRLTSIDYPGTAEDVVYTYDTCTNGIGRLCQVTDGSGTTSFAYDQFGNITTQQKTELGIAYITSYTYDNADSVSTITYPDGRVITYIRDTLGRISSVTATVNGTTTYLVSNRVYRPDNLLLAQTYGNNISETRQYDLQGRLTSQYLGSADTRVYGYDANSNLTSLQSLPQVGSYSYDALDRLTTDSITSSPTSSVSFTYDANGNRTSDGATYTYTTNSNRLTQVGGASITTDTAGNITSNGIQTYAYNNIGQLQSVTQSSTTLATYVYNHLRQRTEKTTASGTTVYHYDLNGSLILETAANGTSLAAYVYANSVPIAQINRSGSTDTLAYLHADHEGTPRLGTNAGQTVVWRFEGRAFGSTAPTGTMVINLRFPGQYYDAESALLYNWNRYYSAALGRYLTSDPIGLRGGLNTYAYVANNPLRWTDSSGLAIGDMPPPPPGYSSNWPTGQFSNGKWWTQPPGGGGDKWIAHTEDPGHWRHWDIQGPNGEDKGTWPKNAKKPWKGQKKLKPGQCPTDPNGDTSQWKPPVPPDQRPEVPTSPQGDGPDGPDTVPFVPLAEPWIGIPGRVPVFEPLFIW